MKPKFALIVMFFVMLFSLAMVAQDSGAKPADGKAACACCSHDGASAADCCKDGKCDMKDGKMDCCKDVAKAKSCCKKMAKGKSCCKDGKCEMAKSDKPCCGKSCKMSKPS